MIKRKQANLENFAELTKKQQKLVKLLFEDETTLAEQAKILQVGERTISTWKTKPVFVKAQHEYAVAQLDNAVPTAVKGLMKLITGSKSEMVRLQAIQTVFKRAGLFTDNGTPELDKARIRKANADARVAEARAKAMEDNGQDMEQLLDKMLDTLTKEDKKNGNN